MHAFNAAFFELKTTPEIKTGINNVTPHPDHQEGEHTMGPLLVIQGAHQEVSVLKCVAFIFFNLGFLNKF